MGSITEVLGDFCSCFLVVVIMRTHRPPELPASRVRDARGHGDAVSCSFISLVFQAIVFPTRLVCGWEGDNVGAVEGSRLHMPLMFQTWVG